MRTLILIAILALIALFCEGCNKPDVYHPIRFSDGHEVSCKWVMQYNCGITAYDCIDGRVYTCQTNVEYLKWND